MIGDRIEKRTMNNSYSAYHRLVHSLPDIQIIEGIDSKEVMMQKHHAFIERSQGIIAIRKTKGFRQFEQHLLSLIEAVEKGEVWDKLSKNDVSGAIYQAGRRAGLLEFFNTLDELPEIIDARFVEIKSLQAAIIEEREEEND